MEISIDAVVGKLSQQIGQLTVNLSLKELQVEALTRENAELVKQLEAVKAQLNTDQVNQVNA